MKKTQISTLLIAASLIACSSLFAAGNEHSHSRPEIDHYAWIRSSLRQPGLSDEACRRILDFYMEEDEGELEEPEEGNPQDTYYEENVPSIEAEEAVTRPNYLDSLFQRYPDLLGYADAFYRVIPQNWTLLSFLLVGNIVYSLLPESNILRLNIEIMKMVTRVDIPLSDLAL